MEPKPFDSEQAADPELHMLIDNAAEGFRPHVPDEIAKLHLLYLDQDDPYKEEGNYLLRSRYLDRHVADAIEEYKLTDASVLIESLARLTAEANEMSIRFGEIIAAMARSANAARIVHEPSDFKRITSNVSMTAAIQYRDKNHDRNEKERYRKSPMSQRGWEVFYEEDWEQSPYMLVSRGVQDEKTIYEAINLDKLFLQRKSEFREKIEQYESLLTKSEVSKQILLKLILPE